MGEDVILTLIEGEDYAVSLTFENDDGSPISFEGFTSIESQIREDFSHTSDVLANFETSVSGKDYNTLNLLLTHAEIDDLRPTVTPQSPRGAGSYWDVFGVNPAGSRRLLAKGRVRFQHTITREAP